MKGNNMKQRIIILIMACAAITASVPGARAQVELSASVQINAPTDFYQPLTPWARGMLGPMAAAGIQEISKPAGNLHRRFLGMDRCRLVLEQ